MKRRRNSSEYFRESVARRMISDEAVAQMRAQAEAMYRKPALSEIDPTLESAGHDQAPSKEAAPVVEITSGEPAASAASPWTKQVAEDVRSSALPSLLRPRDLSAEGDAPESELPAGVPVGGHRKTAIMAGIVTFVVAVGIGVVALRAPVNGVEGAATVAPSASVAAVASSASVAATSTAAASAPQPAVPTSSGTSSAEPAPAPTPSSAPAPARPHQAPKGVRNDDPYGDASAPTAQPQAPAAPTATMIPTAVPSAPPPPTAPSNNPTEDPIEGPRVFGK
jgi:hypothetical protein